MNDVVRSNINLKEFSPRSNIKCFPFQKWLLIFGERKNQMKRFF